MTQDATRTGHLLALMNEGDVAFNARDHAAMDAVHDPDLIAYITGSPEPLYGRAAHAEAMEQMFRGDWITVVTRTTGTFTGEMTLPDGTVIPPTGEAFDIEFGQTSRWDDDRLVVISAFWDSAQQARQLGLG